LKRLSRTLIESSIYRLSSLLNTLAGVVLMFMMVLTTADVCLRYFFKKPIMGAFELTEQLMAVLVFFGLGYAQIKKSHVCVDLLVSRFTKKKQAAIDSLTSILSSVLLLLVTRQTILYALGLLASGRTAGTMGLFVIYPFAFLAALGVLVFLLISLMDLLNYAANVVKR
jgi:TRAP-type C4-dicarboxylate transport system permease small subunit